MLKPDDIESVIAAALTQAAHEAYEPSFPENRRPYQCSIGGCAAPAYAKKLCNAHYIRQRNGKDMAAPIRARHHNGKCRECGREAGGKGGWGLCQRHYRRKRRGVIRQAAIRMLGGKCTHCSGVFPAPAFDFHHTDPTDKELHPSDMIDNYSISAIAQEFAKCILLCANCHRVEHSHDNQPDDRRDT